MKLNKIIKTLTLTTLIGTSLVLSACSQSSSSENNNSSLTESINDFSWAVDTTKTRTSFFVGDEFNSDGLIVSAFTLSKNENTFQAYVGKDQYRLSLEEGHILTKDDTKIDVLDLDGNVKCFYEVTISPTTSTKKLHIKTLPNKTEYIVGENFTYDGLEVELIEVENNTILSRALTNDYIINVPTNRPLPKGNFEVMIMPKDDSVHSTSFNIIVKEKAIEKTIYSIVTELLETSNYTVENLITGNNRVTGIITDNAVKWTSSVEGFYNDNKEGYGYSSLYNEETKTYDTFRFVYDAENDNFKNTAFIKDTTLPHQSGLSHGEDFGLWSKKTRDEYWYRISNYNLRDITEEELNYIKNDIYPLDDNPNKYEIDVKQSKWIWNLVGYRGLFEIPERMLDRNNHIFLEIVEDGLRVELQGKPQWDESFWACDAIITNIGTTVMPGYSNFMKHPVVGKGGN